MRKFTKRHRWGVGVAALVTVIIAAFVGVLLRQQGALERQRDRARTEAQTARQVSGFMVDLFEASSPYQEPDTVTARTLLRRGQQRIGDLEGQPAVRARLLGAMGEAQWGLGNYERADSLLQEALSLFHRDAVGARSRRAEVLSVLGDLRSDEYRWEDAIPHLRKARSLLRETPSPPSRADTLLRAEVLKELGGALRNVGKPDSAETLVRRALALRRRALGPEHKKTLAAKEALAYVLRKKSGRNGSLGKAERLYREVLAAQREHGDSLGVARTLNDLGYLLGEQGNLADEEERYRQALRIYEAQLGRAHPTTLMARGNNLSYSHKLQGDYAAAERVLREQLRIVRAHYPPDHWRVGKWASMLGEAILFQGENLAESEKLLREGVRVYRASDVPDPRYVRAFEAVLGRCLLERGDVQQGLPLLRKSRPVLASDSVGFPRDLAHANVGLGLAHMRHGRYRRADSLLSAARATLDSLYYDAWEGRAPLPPVRQVERHLDRLYEASGRPPRTSGR
jgi:tetratricopeptide (TPR) repeat protein